MTFKSQRIQDNTGKYGDAGAIIAYNKVTFQPKVTHINPTIMGLSNGETNKKVRVGPNPAFADNKPRNIGIVEQLQNGVTAPNRAARR